jgi:hypothetical protein
MAKQLVRTSTNIFEGTLNKLQKIEEFGQKNNTMSPFFI